MSVRRVTSEDDRKSFSSDYLSLDEGEKFLGIALFEADPSIEDPGYFEYFEHWPQGLRGSVPCAGDDCIYCEDGDRPRSKAKSLWWVLEDAKGTEVNKLMIFNLGAQLLKQFTEYRGEGEKILGREFRVTHPDQKTYVLMPKTATHTKKEVKEFLANAPELDELLNAQLRKAMEGVAIARAMADDDDDETPKAAKKASGNGGKGAKGKSAKEPETDAEWPDSLEDDEVIVESVDDDGNFFTATSTEYEGSKDIYTTEGIEFDLSELGEAQIVTVSATQDGDGDYILDGEPEATVEPEEEEGAANDLPDSIEDEEFVIAEIDTASQTFEVKSDELGLEFTLFFLDAGPASKVDFDDYKVGSKIKVTAEKDNAGDLCATAIPEIVKAKAAKKTTPAKKGAAKKGAKGKK